MHRDCDRRRDGIGRAVTARFAAANWHVIALDLDASRLTQAWAGVGKVTPVALDDYRRTFDVNVLGTLLVSQAAVPYLPAAQRASVVNFPSTGAYTAGDGARVLHKAAKAAVVSLTRSMAFELAVDGISVNGLAPGPVVTEGSTSDGSVHDFLPKVPLGRLTARGSRRLGLGAGRR